MKILAFVDTHGSLAALKRIEKMAKDANILICAGDLSVFEQDLDLLIERLNKIGKPVLIIHGNHETEEEMKKSCSLFKNVTYFHKKVHVIDNYAFVGYGGGGFSVTDKKFETWTKKIKPKLKNKKVVLVTHAPPYNTKVDNIMGDSCGNKSIRKFIENVKPVLSISGHLHECVGTDKINKSRLINPGPAGKILII
ncbi:metallophosphoesterase [Nanoarchaeota archaeon]